MKENKFRRLAVKAANLAWDKPAFTPGQLVSIASKGNWPDVILAILPHLPSRDREEIHAELLKLQEK